MAVHGICRRYSRSRPAAKGATPWRTLRPRSMVRRRSQHTNATGGNPSRRRYPIPRRGSGRRGARRRGRWRRAPGMANGSRPPIGVIRSSCWRSRRPRGCPSWCRSAMGGCWCRRSRSSAARPTRWRPIWPVRRGPGWTCSSVAMRICPTSVAFAGPDRRLVFSINDFDETLPGPFEWDVKRLVASFAVAGRDRGFDAKQRRSINRAVTRSYREAIRELRRDVQPGPLVLAHRRGPDRRAGGREGHRESSGSGSSATWRRRARRTA